MNTEQLERYVGKLEARLMEVEKNSKHGFIEQLEIINKKVDTFIKEESAIVANLDGEIKGLKVDVNKILVELSENKRKFNRISLILKNLEVPHSMKKSKIAQIIDIFR